MSHLVPCKINVVYLMMVKICNYIWRCSASAVYANYDLPNLDTVIIIRFIHRLSVSQNFIVSAIEQSWLVRNKLWDVWAKFYISK